MPKRYIITGAPGTGKTSLINTLADQGYNCMAEVSRKIIIEQQNRQQNKTPWGDLTAFATLYYERTVKELEQHITTDTFVDRGLPDIIAYLHTQSLIIPKSILDFPYKDYYHTTVFFLPIWKYIYSNDPQRPQSYQEAILINNALLHTYQNLNFDIKLLPKTSTIERASKIIDIL